MYEDWMERVLLKLVGKGAMAYALHADGMLSVVDRKGQKHLFTPLDYRHLLPGELKNKEGITLRGKHVQP
ncbi:MAG: hypothetical protein WBI14_01250 [Anaerolineaceae bacterium]